MNWDFKLSNFHFKRSVTEPDVFECLEGYIYMHLRPMYNGIDCIFCGYDCFIGGVYVGFQPTYSDAVSFTINRFIHNAVELCEDPGRIIYTYMDHNYIINRRQVIDPFLINEPFHPQTEHPQCLELQRVLNFLFDNF